MKSAEIKVRKSQPHPNGDEAIDIYMYTHMPYILNLLCIDEILG